MGSIDNSTGCSPDGYADYTDLMTNLARGETHDVTVSSGWDPQYLSMWIDYNDNFFFEAHEKVIAEFAFDLGATTDFDLPDTATLGEHLVRIKASDVISNVVDPCADMTYGETEDYMVNILPGETGEGPLVDFIADIIIAPPTTTISYTDLSTEDPNLWAWTITPASGWLYTGGTTASSQDPSVQFNEEGLYTISLLASNDFGSATETKPDYITIANFENIVENFPFGITMLSREANLFQYEVLGSSEPFTISIHDAMGRLVYQKNVSPTTSKTNLNIDLNKEASGYYLLHIKDSKHSKVQKIWVE
jgi:PKD repeat protein